MALINCPDCGNPVSSEAPVCPKCGRPIRAINRRWIVLAAAFVVIGLAFVRSYLAYVHPNANNSYVKGVHSGVKEQVAFFYNLNPDCSVMEYPEVIVERTPTAGTVSTEQGQDYPQYDRDNIRFDCDKNKAGAVLVFYQSKNGFKGRDTFTILVRFADTKLWTMTYVINVL